MVDTYRIRVTGHLDDRWSDWLGGWALHLEEDGTTMLVGQVVDQAALHGVIARIRDLGLPLLSVQRAPQATVTHMEDAASVEGATGSSALLLRRNRPPCGCRETSLHA